MKDYLHGMFSMLHTFYELNFYFIEKKMDIYSKLTLLASQLNGIAPKEKKALTIFVKAFSFN